MSSPSNDNQDELSLTDKRLIDQLGHLAPQIHLTLVSVLQSIALAFLLASFHGPRSNSPSALWSALLTHHLYLPHIASFLVIIIAWNEYAYATLFLHWPLTAFSTALQFLVAVAEIAAFTNVDHVGLWTIWIGIMGLLAAFIHYRNASITSGDLYPHGDIAVKTSGKNDWPAWGLGVLIILGLFRIYSWLGFAYTVTLGGIHVTVFDFAMPLIAIAVAVVNMVEDNRYYITTTNDVLAQSSSPYRLAKNGQIIKRSSALPVITDSRSHKTH